MLLEREVLMITIANPEKYVAGLYERLSNETIEVGNGEVIVSNEDERESGSISTQKLFLRNFCKENNIRVYDDYTDDGYSGATFDRPDFNRMIKDIENKKINLIIVKDLSRFGRLSSKISYYLEEFFIEKGVRFIAVTDDIDTGHIETSEEMVQFKAFFNEWLLRDTSRKARNGKKTRAKEELTSATTTAYDEATGKVDKAKLKESLGTGWSVDGEEGGPYTVKSPKSPNGNNYKITSNGTILEENTLAYIYCPKEVCTNETHLHKGDYVEYKPTTVAQAYDPDKGEGIGKYTGYTAEQSIPQEELNWRVLGQDDNGNILLISGAPTKTGLGFKGHVGYNNYETVLNDTCRALYSNTELGATAKSITMDDIDKYLGGRRYNKAKFNGGSTVESGYGYQNENAITSKFKYNKETNTLTKEDCIISAKDLKSNAYWYAAPIGGFIGAKNREILLGEEEENAYYNWVASRAICVDNDYAKWCMSNVGGVYGGRVSAYDGICFAGGHESSWSLCVRPVVTLSSIITIEQVSKKDGQVQETWNDPLNKY